MAVNMAIYIYKEFSVRKSATAGMKTNCLALAFDAMPKLQEFLLLQKECFHHSPLVKNYHNEHYAVNMEEIFLANYGNLHFKRQEYEYENMFEVINFDNKF